MNTQNRGYLVVTGVGPIIKAAKNGRHFQKVTFTEAPKTTAIAGKEVTVTSTRPSQTRNVWEDFTDAEGKFFKGDSVFNSLEVGAVVEGDIVTSETTPYQIGEEDDARVVGRYTCVVFGHEDPISYINGQLKSKNACVVVNGQPTNLEIAAAMSMAK